MIYYKIRKKSNPAQYVAGTPCYHSYNNIGRIFQKIGQLRSFITGVINDRTNTSDISDWEVVELEMVVKEVKDLHHVIKPEKIIALLGK